MKSIYDPPTPPDEDAFEISPIVIHCSAGIGRTGSHQIFLLFHSTFTPINFPPSKSSLNSFHLDLSWTLNPDIELKPQL